jgi:hypothetical protein
MSMSVYDPQPLEQLLDKAKDLQRRLENYRGGHHEFGVPEDKTGYDRATGRDISLAITHQEDVVMRLERALQRLK